MSVETVKGSLVNIPEPWLGKAVTRNAKLGDGSCRRGKSYLFCLKGFEIPRYLL